MSAVATATNMNLTERALLVNLVISKWGNRKQNKQVSGKANADHGVGDKAGRYNNYLLIENLKGEPAKEYEAIVTIRNKMNVVHREQTVSWLDDGTRVLAAANYNHWALIVNEYTDKYYAAADYFTQEYPRLIEQTRYYMEELPLRDGKPSMFNAGNYPAPQDIRRRFEVRVNPAPLPWEGDFRCNLTGGQVDIIKSQIQASMQSVIMNSTQELFERLRTLALRVANLGNPRAPIHEGLVDDVNSITRLAERLNIADDSNLNAMAQRIRDELSFSKMSIKTSPQERENLAARADQIISDMSAFMGSEED